MARYIKALVKVTNYPDAIRNGKLYMNELRYYTKCDEEEMADKCEARSLEISMCNYSVRMLDENCLNKPVFCMYGVYGDKHSNTKWISLPERMKKFGSYAVIVLDVDAYFEKLENAHLEHSSVMYYPKDVDANSKDFLIPYNPIYRKLHPFSYQSEFRIVNQKTVLTKNSADKYEWDSYFNKVNDDHIIVDIGDIHAITSEPIPIEELICPKRYSVDLKVNWDRVKDVPLYTKPSTQNK